MTPLIQADYEQLAQIAARFGLQRQATQSIQQQIRQQVDTLCPEHWEGHGSQAFQSEMTDDIYPAINRFIQSLHEAQQITQQIVLVMQAAEQEASIPFKASAPPSEPVPNAPRRYGNGRSPRSFANPRVNTTPAWERPTEEQVNDLFSPEKMDELIGYQHPITYPEAMGDAMESLFRIPPLAPESAETQALLQEMATAYGGDVTTDYLGQQYEQYVTLFNEAYPEGEGPAVPLNIAPTFSSPLPGLTPMLTFEQTDFWGTTWQMRYGKVVGDALNIDPVFAAMLNPTGGLVGPGRYAIPVGEDEGLGYHGAVHDAGGYLYKHHHQLGPGYDYLNMERHRDKDNPLTGQQSGIAYWNDHIPGTSKTEIMSDIAAPHMGLFNDYGMIAPLGAQAGAVWESFTNLLDF